MKALQQNRGITQEESMESKMAHAIDSLYVQTEQRDNTTYISIIINQTYKTLKDARIIISKYINILLHKYPKEIMQL